MVGGKNTVALTRLHIKLLLVMDVAVGERAQELDEKAGLSCSTGPKPSVFVVLWLLDDANASDQWHIYGRRSVWANY